MKSIKTLAMGAAVALALVGASSASAANWDPQNTNVTAVQEGTGALTAPNGTVSCTAADTTLRASGATATAITTTNPVAFTGCNGGFLGAATVTTFGTWSFTATSTTSVDVSAVNPSGPVATIHFPSAGCDITVPSPVNITGSTWNNATHTLHIGSSSFALSGSGNSGLAGTSGVMDANFVASAATIT